MEASELRAEAQELFNTVASHLLTQNARAERSIGIASGGTIQITFTFSSSPLITSRCVFRTEDGKKCAIGCLIPDDQYDPKMDADYGTDFPKVLDYLDKKSPLREKLERHTQMLRSLQVLHDQVPVDSWAEALKKLAEEWELVWPAKETANDSNAG